MTAEIIGTAALLLASAPVQQARVPLTMAPDLCPTVMTLAGSIGMPVTAATSVAAAPALAVGPRSRVALADAAGVRFAVAPGHAEKQGPAAGTRGGLLAVTISTPGRYRVGLSGPAWIDVVRGKTALHSVAHSDGDACSPLKRLVDFDLVPGRYLIQLAGSTAPSLWVGINPLR